jgi:hypothetical protein
MRNFTNIAHPKGTNSIFQRLIFIFNYCSENETDCIDWSLTSNAGATLSLPIIGGTNTSYYVHVRGHLNEDRENCGVQKISSDQFTFVPKAACKNHSIYSLFPINFTVFVII